MTRKAPFGDGLVILISALVGCAVGLYAGAFGGLSQWNVAAHVVALAAWACHLRVLAVPRLWVLAAVIGLGALLGSGPAAGLDLTALGESIFLYVLLSLFAAYDRQPGLQAIAAVALLMSAGILTKPPVAISCVLAGLTFFWQHRRKTQSGAFGFALLMFTPMTLCLLSAGLLAFLTGSPLSASIRDTPVLSQTAPAGRLWLIFPAGVILWRMAARRTAAPDIAFVLLLAAGATLSFFPWMPWPLQEIDLFYLAIGGAAALFAQSAGTLLLAVR